jgi:hypothetical protein
MYEEGEYNSRLANLNKELPNLCFLADSITTSKSEKVRWAGCVARMRQMRNRPHIIHLSLKV